MVGIICNRGKTSKGQISKEQKKPLKKKIQNLSQAERCMRSKIYNLNIHYPFNLVVLYTNGISESFSDMQEIPIYIKELPEYKETLKSYNDSIKSIRLLEYSEKLRQARKEQFQISKHDSHRPTHRPNNLPIISSSPHDAIFESLSSIY